MYNAGLYNEMLFNLQAYPSLKHYLIRGFYREQALECNRLVIVGKDVEDGFIYGEAVDDVELERHGERLDFRLVPQLRSQAEVSAVAQAVIEDMRMEGRYAVVTLPPHCGVEIGDVVRVHDAVACQQGADYRVLGVRFDFNALTGAFVQRLYMGRV